MLGYLTITITIVVRIMLCLIAKGTELIFLFGFIIFPIHSVLIINKLSSNNKYLRRILFFICVFWNIYEWDVMSNYAIREFISIKFFDGINMTKDPGTQTITVIFALISLIPLFILYGISEKDI